MCVGALDATLRFFALGAGADSSLKLEVLLSGFGGLQVRPFATLTGSGRWQVTSAMAFFANLAALSSPSGTTLIAFRFTAVGPGDWKIDDLYVDPFQSR